MINDDTVQAGCGFPTHGHRDIEILSYVPAGTLEHKDSMGNRSQARLDCTLRSVHKAYLRVARGRVRLNEAALHTGDAAPLSNESVLRVAAEEDRSYCCLTWPDGMEPFMRVMRATSGIWRSPRNTWAMCRRLLTCRQKYSVV